MVCIPGKHTFTWPAKGAYNIRKKKIQHDYEPEKKMAAQHMQHCCPDGWQLTSLANAPRPSAVVTSAAVPWTINPFSFHSCAQQAHCWQVVSLVTHDKNIRSEMVCKCEHTLVLRASYTPLCLLSAGRQRNGGCVHLYKVDFFHLSALLLSVFAAKWSTRCAAAAVCIAANNNTTKS